MENDKAVFGVFKTRLDADKAVAALAGIGVGGALIGLGVPELKQNLMRIMSKMAGYSYQSILILRA